MHFGDQLLLFLMIFFNLLSALSPYTLQEGKKYIFGFKKKSCFVMRVYIHVQDLYMTVVAKKNMSFSVL